MTGRFIALEGGEGSGKSTQARLLADELGAVATYEPGDTAVGAAIRALLLDPATSGLDDRAEALLMAADLAQHAREVIRPALASGRHVVCDRYVASSIAPARSAIELRPYRSIQIVSAPVVAARSVVTRLSTLVLT